MANRKKEDQHERVSPEVKEALKKNDVEALARKSKTMQIEGQIPYERNLYINEVRFLIQRTVGDILDAGKRLLVIREKEGYGEFIKICEEEIGLPHSTVYRFMNAALKTEKYPQISFENFSHVGKVYALMDAPEEDLKELEKKGVLAGNTVEDLQIMSVKEMRDLIKKLKHDTDKVIKAEVKTIETEKKALVKELDRLKAFDPEGKDASWCIEQMKTIDKIADEFDAALRRFVKDPRILEHPEIQAKVEAIQTRMEKRFGLFVQEWNSFVEAEGE